MTVADASRALIALAIADWLVTAVLLLAAHRLKEAALSERAVASLVLTFAATAFALLGAHVLGLIALPADVRMALLVGAALLVSLPQIVWFVGLLAGKFR